MSNRRPNLTASLRRSINRPTARPGLSPLDEQRLRRRLRRAVPSEPWVDAQIKTLHDTAPDAAVIAIRYHDPRVFPPGGCSTTAMKWCRTCGRYTPPNCIHLIEHRRKRSGPVLAATLQCDDCRIAVDIEIHGELYDALPQLRPAGSMSFVRRHDLFSQRRKQH